MIPSYFLAHGAPSIVLEDNEYTRYIKQLKDQFPRPKAIVIFSAHWEEQTQSVGTAEIYDTIYDFGGFQDELYQMKYPAKGDRGLSEQIRQLLTAHGIQSVTDERRGLDHGAWAVLKLLYPQADIPVVAMSVNRYLTNEQQYQIGTALAALREQDVLIIGSGGTSHNLRKVNWRAEQPDEWAVRFEQWIQDQIESWNVEALFHYRDLAPHASEAVPTSEHFIPLLLAMGAGHPNRQAKLLHRSFQYGNLSLCCWEFQ